MRGLGFKTAMHLEVSVSSEVWVFAMQWLSLGWLYRPYCFARGNILLSREHWRGQHLERLTPWDQLELKFWKEMSPLGEGYGNCPKGIDCSTRLVVQDHCRRRNLLARLHVEQEGFVQNADLCPKIYKEFGLALVDANSDILLCNLCVVMQISQSAEVWLGVRRYRRMLRPTKRNAESAWC